MNDWKTWVVLILIGGGVLAMVGIWIAVLIRAARQTTRQAQAFFTTVPKPTQLESPGNAFLESKAGQRVVALACAAFGLWGALSTWRDVQNGEGFGFAESLVFPFFAVLGLGMTISPHDVEAQRWKYGTSKPRTWSETPLNMKIISVLAILAGIGNLIALYVFTHG